MGPRFSVCIPNYNHGAFLAATVDSVLAQDFDDFEIVVSDNASTDDSRAVLGRYADERRLRVTANDRNIGLSGNFEAVARSARGDHLLMLSADDLMHPTALSRYAEVLDELGPAAAKAVLCSAYDVIDTAGELLFAMHRPLGSPHYGRLPPTQAERADRGGPVERTPGRDALTIALRHRLAPAPFVATCYPRAYHRRAGGYHSGFRAWPDTHFLLELLSEGPELVYVPQRLFSYRVHPGNQYTLADRQGALFYQIDSYLHTIEFPQHRLDELGVARADLVTAYLRRAVFGRATRAVGRGQAALGRRILTFGLATYPLVTLRSPDFYRVAALSCSGALGRRRAAARAEV